ncbi:hypothetical protein ACHQM5_008964 [Ranunculus cassubicifolius]
MDEAGEEMVEMSDTAPLSRNGSFSSTISRNGSFSSTIIPIDSPEMPEFVASINSRDDWFPITASRNGNSYYAAFHSISSGIGSQALTLPVAFTTLGWTWGIISLSLMFVWQIYTKWLLIQLHESVPGTRFDRYLQLSSASFGERLGKLLTLFPVMYLSGATCVMFIMFAGDGMKLFMKINNSHPLTTIECYLLFACLATFIATLLPNFNSAAWISFVGALTAVVYCTLLWSISIAEGRLKGISYDPVTPKSDINGVFSVFNALGITALAFRGHNLVLETQATMPSSLKKKSSRTMWRGVIFAYFAIAFCLFPLAICGFWAYGNEIATHRGMLNTLDAFHQHDTSRSILKLIAILIVIHCLCAFQIYAMPILDNLTSAYIAKKKKPASKWIQIAIRIFFGCLTFFIAVAVPFIRSLSGLIGGIVLTVTVADPCFMWISIKKPERWSGMWCANFLLGTFGVVLSVIVFAGGIYGLVNPGIYVRFFKA